MNLYHNVLTIVLYTDDDKSEETDMENYPWNKKSTFLFFDDKTMMMTMTKSEETDDDIHGTRSNIKSDTWYVLVS